MSSAPAAIIELDGLCRRFGTQVAVESLSLTVRRGEVVGLLGANGAGKTTTLRMLAGLLSPTSGRARVCGFDVALEPLEARARLGFLTGTTGLYERLTGREVLGTFGRLYGLDGERLTGRIDQVARDLDLRAILDKRCGSLSAGQRQRVSIARAVLHDPEAYVLDEPTAALDPLSARAILELIRGARGRDRAVLFSTHRMEEAEYLCDRIAFLREGRVVVMGTAEELKAHSGQSSLTGAFLHYAA